MSQQTDTNAEKRPVRVTNTGDGDVYVVKNGDCIESIAFEKGFFPETIWNDKNNNELKKVRKSKNILLPADEVYIPAKIGKEKECSTEQRHRFRRKGVPSQLTIELKIEDEPQSNKEISIIVDGVIRDGKTDGNGRISVTIRPNAQEGKIRVKEGGEEFDLHLGGLDPIDTISGIQARLMNLGYEVKVTGRWDEDTTEAIKMFQSDQSIEVTGELNDATKSKIEEIYSF